VICSNSSSLPEVAGDAAVLVNPRRADRLSRELASVLESTALQASLRERALARSKEYVWDRTARQTVAVYEKTVGR
jgi:alpha-1,3-rhamnosyl/mannosyltransferase